MEKRLVLFFLIGLFIISLINIISAEEFGYTLLESGKNLNPSTNLSLTTVNASGILITDQGNVDNLNASQFEVNDGVLNIIQDFLTDLITVFGLTEFLALDGSNANTNIDIGIFNFSTGSVSADFGLFDSRVGIGGGGIPPTCSLDLGGGQICNVLSLTSGPGTSQTLLLQGTGAVAYVGDSDDSQGAVSHSWYFDSAAEADREMELEEGVGLWVRNNIVADGIGSVFNQTLMIDGHDTGASDATLVIQSEINLDACINLTEGGLFGFRICYDGSGAGRLAIDNMRDGARYMEIDRISGNITFLNDTFFTNINVETLNVTGDMNVSGNLNISGNVEASSFFGDGSNLFNVNTSNSLHLNQDNWENDTDNWINWDTINSRIVFNSSKLSTQFFNASTIEVITGTPEGAIGDLRSYNNLPYNISEDASDFEFIVNFTEITDFNQLIIRHKSEEDVEPHVVEVQIWDTTLNDWESYGTLSNEDVYHIVVFGIFDVSDHIDIHNTVQVRFFQDGGLPPRTHKHNFDWVALAKGFGTPAGEEIDRIFESWLGDPIFERNVNGTKINFTTTGSFIGDGSYLYNVNITGIGVPYIGAVADVDLGIYNLTTGRIGVGSAITSILPYYLGQFEGEVSSNSVFIGTGLIVKPELITNNTNITGIYTQVVTNNDFNIPNTKGLHIDDILEEEGTQVEIQYGLYMGDQTKGEINYAIYSLGGQSVHAGNLRIGDSSAPTVALDVAGEGLITSTTEPQFRIFNNAEYANFSVVEGSWLKITSSSGIIYFDDENIATTGQASLGATSLTTLTESGLFDLNDEADIDGDAGSSGSTPTNAPNVLDVKGGTGGIDTDLGGTSANGSNVIITAGAGGSQATEDAVGGDGGDITLTPGIGGAAATSGDYGNIYMAENGGCVTIGTTNVSRCNATDIFVVDGYSWGLGWRVDSDRSLKKDISIIDESSTRKLNKYKIQYDYPIYENYQELVNVSVCDEKTCWEEEQEITQSRVLRYETGYTPFQTGLIIDEIPEEDAENFVHCIGNKCGIDVYELASLNYVDIGINQDRLDVLETENQMLNNRFDEVCEKDNCVNKYSWCGCPEL